MVADRRRGGGPAARTRRRRRRGTWPPAGNYRVDRHAIDAMSQAAGHARGLGLLEKGDHARPLKSALFGRSLHGYIASVVVVAPNVKEKRTPVRASSKQTVDRQRDGLAARRPE